VRSPRLSDPPLHPSCWECCKDATSPFSRATDCITTCSRARSTIGATSGHSRAWASELSWASAAVGSLREEIRPGDLALSSQYLDFTKGLRAATFFGRGLVAHVSTANPTCSTTAGLVARSARALELSLHENKTHACIEGPRFGTRAESLFLRNSGADLVGMTNVPEAFLACEAQLGYCTIGVATDYDSWLDDAEHHVSAVQVAKLFRGNLERVQQLIGYVVADYTDDESRPCRHTLEGAIMTPRERMTAAQRSLISFLTV
jgi:5'-methylthioadenosine phosphorylase